MTQDMLRLEDSLSLLADFSRQHAVERAVAITQQRWDERESVNLQA